MSAYEAKVQCSVCGQSLVLSVQDLREVYRCPRCGMAQPAAGLIDPGTPLRAIPVAPSEPPDPTPDPQEHADAEEAVRAVCDEPLAGRVRAPTVDHSEDDQAASLELLKAGSSRPPEVSPGPAGIASPKLVSDRPDLATRALRRVDAATWWVERQAHGRRLPVLALAGIAVVGSWLLAPAAYPITMLVYGCLLWLLLVAKIWWIRGDDGEWAWATFVDRLILPTRESVLGLLEVETFTPFVLLARLRVVLLGVGVFLMVFAAPLATLAAGGLVPATSGLSSAELLGVGSVLAGIALWLLRRFERRSPDSLELAETLRRITAPATSMGAVDLNEPLPELPAELTQLAELLSGWEPRWNATRAAYEGSLVRYLRKKLPGVPIATQQPLESREGDPLGMLDVVIDDSLVIEVRRRFEGGSDIEHAIRKVSHCAEAWRKGPVILLVCETRRGFATAPWTRQIAVLQALGRPVFALAAGKRL